MFWKLAPVSTLCFLFLTGAAAALDPSDPPSDEVLNNTLQCEAGQVGAELRRRKLPEDMKVAVSWTISKTEDTGWGFGAKVPLFDIGVDLGATRQQLDEALSTGIPFNLNQENKQVCRGYKIEIIKSGVGLSQCLIKKMASLKNIVAGGSGTTGCRSKVTLVKKIGGSAKIPVWGVLTVGPSGSYGDTYVMDFTVVAPLRPK